MLLAAGLGTRMRPLTDSVPKPLIEVCGRALLERVATAAAGEGCRHFVVNVHHLADRMERGLDALRGAHLDWDVAVSDERAQRLESGGGTRKALPLLPGDPILVMNTDSFWRTAADRPLARMAAAFDGGGVDAMLLCAQPHRALGFRRSHDFCLAPNGAITLDQGAPVIYAGVALLSRRLFDETPEGPFSLNLLFEAALGRERLGGVVLDAPWYHVGDPQALAQTEAALAGVA